MSDCQLYVITPPKIDLEVFTPKFKAAFEGGDIACIQIRLKDTSDDHILEVANALIPIAHEHGTPVLINDRPDLALKTGADGVHIGKEDTPYKEARKILGDEVIVGVTCHDSRHLAMSLGEDGADYVAFGAFYPTRTKTPKTTAPLELLEWWSALFELPCVAIGGITPENARPLVDAGADFLAVSNAIWSHPDGPAAAVAAFNRVFDSQA